MESSPSVLSPPPTQQAYYQSQLDFFSLAGLNGNTPSGDFESPQATAGGEISSNHHHHTPGSSHGYEHRDHDGFNGNYSRSIHEGDSPLDDPSPINLDIGRPPSGPGKSRRAASSHPQTHSRTHSRHSNVAEQSARPTRGSPMEVDHHASSGAPSGSHSGTDGGDQQQRGTVDLMNMDMAAFDAMQAGLLQHQLESIHMQSPFVSATNPTSPYGQMAQMFLTSPPGQSLNADGSHSAPASHDGRGGHRKFSQTNMLAGVLTPGPSGEMQPEVRMDLMSPMQLEMFARGEFMEGMDNFNQVPLLSPALSQQVPSNYGSPVAQVAFNANAQNSQASHANQQVLEQLQYQQRQFQEQLQLLQEQQRQLQATAAAVAAASGSPYLAPASNNRNAITQGGLSAPQSAHSQGTMSTPSPGSYFSPLTSPALEPAVSRSAHLRAAAAHLSPAMHSQQQRQPTSMPALSSPALNPVGSSGGAQQTLSPALGPQHVDGADPEYLHAFQGMLDGASSQMNEPLSSPIVSPGVSHSASGPHRGSLPLKSRPSPMMKPTTHRSHARQASTSVPTSPMSFKTASGQGYLPPAAIDQRGVQQQQQQHLQHHNVSASSTPSPVDLQSIMPPPPVPAQGARPKSLMPMTPATLMNLGKAAEAEASKPETRRDAPAAPPVRAAAKKATANIAPATTPAPKRGSRLVPSGGAAATKRALAIRPPGGVGVRAATKGAAAAAAASASGEPETRRTSHKAAEQKRRDSLKAGFDELRLLLPPINTEALDPESGEPIPGSSAPRLLPKSSLVPDDNPNRGVSKVALLKFSNEYIVRLHSKVEKRDCYVDKLRDEIRRLRGLGDPALADEEVRGDEGEDLLDMDMLEGEEDDLGSDEEDDEGDDDEADDMDVDTSSSGRRLAAKVSKSPALGPKRTSTRGGGAIKAGRRVSID